MVSMIGEKFGITPPPWPNFKKNFIDKLWIFVIDAILPARDPGYILGALTKPWPIFVGFDKVLGNNFGIL